MGIFIDFLIYECFILGAAMKGEKMHEIVSLGKRTVSEKSDIQMTSGRFPLPVSKLSLNGSGRTLFIEAR